MKFLLLLISLANACAAFGAPNEASQAHKILDLTGSQSFIDGVLKLQEGESVSPSNPYFQELSEDSEFWKSFPAMKYKQGLIAQFKELFTGAELTEVKEFYKDPFRSKMIVLLNTDANLGQFMNKLLSGELGEARASKNKLNLIQSVINLHKINPLIEDQKNQLKAQVERLRKLMKVVENASQTQEAEELRIKENILRNFDTHVLRHFAKAFEGVREAELRELVRVMKPRAKVRDAGQLLTGYHYFFVNKEKLKQINK